MTRHIYKRVCSRFAKGVTVVTTRRLRDNIPVGMTVSSFTGVSIEPPTILICLNRSSSTTQDILESSHFAINFLNEQQRAVSQQFATGEVESRFLGVGWDDGPDGVPLLSNTLGYFVCERGSSVQDGDHQVVFGRVLDGGYREGSLPLVYWASQYQSLQIDGTNNTKSRVQWPFTAMGNMENQG